MPQNEAPGGGGSVAERCNSLRVGASRPGAVGNEDEGAHLVMDVAAKSNHSGLVEMDGARLVLGEEFELEPFGAREGIDVVLGRIEVREGYVRAHRNDGQ